MIGRFTPLLLVALLASCSPEHEVVMACDDESGIHPVCGFQNPEDLAVAPGGGALLVSQMGSMTDPDRHGSLALFDLASEELRVLYPGEPTEPAPLEPKPGWGDPSCPGPMGERLNPHGIDLAKRPDGRLRLLVVNHGGRESIEIFEVTGRGKRVALEWRGCAVAPEDLFFNDVVSLPDGGFLVTHMMSGNPLWGMMRAGMGMNTGAVYEWQAPASWEAVVGTASPFPNGIELSDDGASIYLNVYGTGEVRRISRETGELLAIARVPSPDNSTWTPKGRLLVASHLGALPDQMQCQDLEAGACPMSFQIVSLDANTLEWEPIFANAGPPMGAGTVAIEIGDELVIGSFSGDRIIRVRR